MYLVRLWISIFYTGPFTKCTWSGCESLYSVLTSPQSVPGQVVNLYILYWPLHKVYLVRLWISIFYTGPFTKCIWSGCESLYSILDRPQSVPGQVVNLYILYWTAPQSVPGQVVNLYILYWPAPQSVPGQVVNLQELWGYMVLHILSDHS